jgi:hypothetical protein
MSRFHSPRATEYSPSGTPAVRTHPVICLSRGRLKLTRITHVAAQNRNPTPYMMRAVAVM